jgi:hypothetical protein
MDVHNDTAGWLVLWLEPFGEDRWLRPGEAVSDPIPEGGPRRSFYVAGGR